MVRKLKVLLAILLCLPLMGAWPNTGKKYPGVSASYTGPGDIVATAFAWWGLRAYSTALASGGATTTKVIDVLGSSTVTGCTVFLKGDGTGDLDLTTSGPGGVGNQCASGATTFCTVTNTSCTVSKIYDQSGGNNCTTACNVSQATAAKQPTLTFSCVGAKLCMTFSAASSQVLISASNNNTTSGLSLSAVAESTSGAAAGNMWAYAGFNLQFGFDDSGANNTYFYGGVAVSHATASDNARHAINVRVPAGSTVTFNVDGTETTPAGNNGNDITGSQPQTVGGYNAGNFLTGNLSEVGVWGTLFSGGNRTSMCQNQQSFYGSGNFGAVC